MPPTPHPEAVAGTFSAIISTFLLLLGVPPYTLVWGLIGAAFAMLIRNTEIGRVKAFLIILASAAMAAASGVFFGEWVKSESQALIRFACAVVGFGAQALLAAVVEVSVGNIKRLGGAKVEDK
jgi:hypothetical protein